MPAKKPKVLNKRHDTHEDVDKRSAAEAAVTPRTGLTISLPGALKGHKLAGDVWKRTVGLYLEVDGTIATAFDVDLLVKYCILEEECVWLEGKRDEVDQRYVEMGKQLDVFKKKKPKDDDFKTLYKLYEQYNALGASVRSWDQRLDVKRKLSFGIAQSCYMTPRSRAGVAPPEKPPEKPKSKLADMLKQQGDDVR